MPATLITLAQFIATPGLSLGGRPFGNLIVDSSGALIETAVGGAEIPSGNSELPADTVFEVAKTPGGTPTDQAVLSESNGSTRKAWSPTPMATCSGIRIGGVDGASAGIA